MCIRDRNIEINHDYFNLRYPFWHVHALSIYDSEMTKLCRAALWYSEDVYKRQIFEYSVGNRIYRQHTGWTSNGIFVEGNHCSVVYSFKDPQRSYIKNSGQLIQCIVSTVFVIIGIVALCLGYILQGVL